MNSKYKILALGIAGIAAIIISVLFWPSEKFSDFDGDQPEEELIAEFLNIDPVNAELALSRMTLDQKINTLIMVKVDRASVLDSLSNYGAYFMKSPNYQLLAELDTLKKDTLEKLIGISINDIINWENNQFQFQNMTATETSLLAEMQMHVSDFVKFYGINYLEFGNQDPPSRTRILQDLVQNEYYYKHFVAGLMDSLKTDSLLFAYQLPKVTDTIELESCLPFVTQLRKSGITVLGTSSASVMKTAMMERSNFKGLSAIEVDSGLTVNHFLENDLFITSNPHDCRTLLKHFLKKGTIQMNMIDQKAKRVLMAREWSKPKSNGWHNQATDKYFERQQVKKGRSIQRQGICLVQNLDHVLPFKSQADETKVIRIGQPITSFINGLQHYTKVSSKVFVDLGKSELIKLTNAKQDPMVICFNNVELNLKRDSLFLIRLKELDKTCNLIIVNGSNPNNLDLLTDFETLIQLDGNNSYQWQVCAQALFGGFPLKGKLPFQLNKFDFGAGSMTQKTRIGYALPIDVGLDKDTLASISWLAHQGISNRAFPGCQVACVKDGYMILNNAYGHASYKRQEKVTNEHLYDLASVTKVAATTLAAMKLYDEKKYQLNDSIQKYLPDTLAEYLYNGRSTLRNITWREMLIHKSGLPAGISYIKYVDYIRPKDSIGRFDRFYCDMTDDSCFYMPIAEGFYMDESYQDSIWVSLNQMWLRDDKDYMYSDANFVLLYKLLRGLLDADNKLVKQSRHVEDKDYNAFETYLQEQVYRPLKMNRTCYLPLRYFDKEQITPTEDDKYWRRQLVHGYVHDPTAALLGGISGNAGLFSTAEDMAKLFQMYLNRGTYGGQQYIEVSTVTKFINKQAGSHRGLGFNKPVGGGMYGIPEEVSTSTFGHTGFTGNSIWADPENNIIYIFLSNRSHPDAHNPKIIHLGTRKHMHKAIYRSIIDKSYLVKPPQPIDNDSLMVNS